MKKFRYRARISVAVLAVALSGSVFAAGAAQAGTVSSGYDTSSGTGSLGPAAPGDSITQAQILDRAHDWISQNVPYDQSSGWEDSATGGPYRKDCSGYVSMAWGLSTSMVTSTLPQVSNVTDGNLSGDRSLQAGDALDYTADHVVLFDHWTDSSGDFAYDAEHTYGVTTNQSTGSVDSTTLEGYPISDFEALRYKKVTTSPTSRSVASSPDGTHVFYAGSGGQLMNDYYDSSSGWESGSLPGTVRAGSPIVATNDHVFFISTSGAVENDYYTAATGWVGALGIGGTAAAGSGLATDAAGDHVFFTSSSGQLANDWYDSTNGWRNALLPGNPRAGTGLAADAAGDHVFYINDSGTITNDYMSGSWIGPSELGGTAEAGSGLATTPAGDHVYYTSSSGQLANDWYDSTNGWRNALLPGEPRADSQLAANADHVFYLNHSGTITNDYLSGGAWVGPSEIGGTAEAGSGLAVDTAADHIFFAGSGGAITNDYYSSGWVGPLAIGGTAG